MPHISPAALLTGAIVVLMAVLVLSLVILDRAGCDPALKRHRQVFNILSFSAAFGIAGLMGALRSVA